MANVEDLLTYRTVTVSSPAMPKLLGFDALEFFSIQGDEALSTLFSYVLKLKTPADRGIAWQAASNIDLKQLIGKEMTVSIELDDKKDSATSTREISGIVTRARYVSRSVDQAIYEVILQPWLGLATLTSDYRCFQNLTVVEIIDQVLGGYTDKADSGYRYPAEKRLSGKYAKLDFQVQYGETDFDFIQRLMEEWGIYWFFEHSGKAHRLVLVDHVGAHKKFTNAAYHELHYYPPDHKIDEEYINSFSTHEGLQSGQWLTSDYDFTKSRADIKAIDKKPRKTAYNQMELYQWPGDYEDQAIGEQLARIRMEAAGAPGTRSSGGGDLRGVVCGCTFTLAGYPYEKANREYLIISSALTLSDNGQTSGQGTYSFHTSFVVQPTSKVFRATQSIDKPYTNGPQTAIVVGPAGEQIWTDEYGRVKLRFHWDRYAHSDENDSCWIRVSQAWAGSNFGGIYIPRIGQEVIVDFMGGDPDKPLILGSLYNNVTRPPWELPAKQNHSGFKSQTIHGGTENYNGVQFIDTPGGEVYKEQAEKDMQRLTKNNESHTVGASMDLGVGLNFNTNVAAVMGTAVGGACSLSVGGAYAINVGGAMATAVGGASSIAVGGAFSLVVGGALSIVCGSSSISMTSDGKIKIVGCDVIVEGSNSLNLNPGACGDGGGGGGGGGAGGGGGSVGPFLGVRKSSKPSSSPSPSPSPSPGLPTVTPSSSKPTPTPSSSTPTPTPTPSSSTPEPTPTPSSSTPAPTPTPTPSSSTPAPTPTPSASTPAPTPTPSPSESNWPEETD